MRFTPDLAVAFGDWLERDRIRRALIAARPELAGTLMLDAQRPLLRIPRKSGGVVVVARMHEAEPTSWVVGISDASAPVLHELDSADDVVALTLDLLALPIPTPDGTEPRLRG